MPPLPPHYGLPGAKVIPEGWAAAHAAVVASTYDCTVVIGPTGGATGWVEERGQSETAAALPVYEGPASVGLVTTNDGRRVEAADDHDDERLYEVKIPAGAAQVVAVGHRVLITVCPNPALVDARLLVTSYALPGREFSRSLICALNA